MPERKKPVNGWRAGTDPIQRWLRITTTVVLLAVFVYSATIRESTTTEGLLITALALGSVLLLLGYEGVIRLPMIGRSQEDEEEEDVGGNISAPPTIGGGHD